VYTATPPDLMPAISLVIPAYNEAQQIVRTVTEALDYFDHRGLGYEIIVSADGTDGTREAAGELAATRPEIKVIGAPERRGKGRGIREAVAIATGDVIGFSDADNKTPITEFDKVEPLLADCHVVIGSRAVRGARIERAQPLYRRLGSKGFALFMHAAVGLRDIVDTQCGFKFFRGEVAKELFRRQQIDGYMYDVEILFLAEQLGYRIAETPVRWRDDGDSRLQLVAGNIRNVRDILSVRWRHRDVRRALSAETAPARPADR
jgi:dolichyl-phosphate beta-glucosyltransferase